ncbi:MAG: hypothetical protein Q8L08_08285 [Candidatus Nanopelagicaceae bacterium]|nr:hypothetical protein [Candidatus Nanopelagicaceae bacterium]
MNRVEEKKKNGNSEVGLKKTNPRLKVGVLVVAHEDFTYVGRMDSGVALSSPARIVINFLSGKKSCEELSQMLEIPLDEIKNLVAQLDAAGLLDTEATKISVHTRFHSPNANRASHAGDDSSDGAFQQLKARLVPELTSATWHSHAKDGGVSIVNSRRNWQVNIYGGSRISTLLYGILLSSGVTHTRLQVLPENRAISEPDLCAGFLRAIDVGLSYKTRLDELARELSLFPTAPTVKVDKKGGPDEKSESPEQIISIVIGTPPSDELQAWMSGGVAHLLVDNPDGASLTIGPLVIPGKTPCTRCVSIANEDLNELWRDISWKKQNFPPSEVPVAVAHHVAGFLALELLAFLDAGRSKLIGASARINFHSPAMIQERLYARHPACGCTW